MTEIDRALHASVLRREAVKEREFREQRRKEDEEVMLGFGATDMTKAELKKLIDSDRKLYYRTEELNDKLYIHYKGWRELKNLEGWTGLKALYAEANAFDRIQGLLNCRSLRSLFLQENCIKKISGLEGCPDLWNINLSSNFIERIENISHLRKLNTLTIDKNKIGMRGLVDVEDLVQSTLTSLSIQDNQIWDPDILPEVFMRMTDLRVLYLKGNPCTKKIPNYRKNVTVCCSDLRYLDDRPVFPEDRRAADAFNRGGLEEERAERRRIREENNAKHERNMKAFNEMIASARAEKRERDAMRGEDKFTDDTDPVDSHEKRMKRQVDKWREENADELKDEAKENAVKCLRQEREQREREQGGGEADKAELADADASGEEEPAKEAGAEAVTDEPREQKKVDNRKLVYDDIWDDGPTSEEPSAAKSVGAMPPPPDTHKAAPAPATCGAAPANAGSAPSRPSTREPSAGKSVGAIPSPPDAHKAALAPATCGAAPSNAGAAPSQPSTQGIFLPWASGEGVVGMDSVAPSQSALACRAAELQVAERRSTEGQGGTPSSGAGGYSKYTEKLQEPADALDMWSLD